MAIALTTRKSAILDLQFLRRVSPGECGLASSDGDPGTNGVFQKLAAELGINTQCTVLQPLFVPPCMNDRSLLTPRLQAGVIKPTSVKAVSTAWSMCSDSEAVETAGWLHSAEAPA
ncbi:MAG: hypothetical protein DMF24_08085 [Verrucomicrobia bacterium]|nr:MAG: hypothetical protein DME90_01760 [Verrucomicrobiota bacterium]PYL61188.1 MAG: hypothetical protein DMF24_08085 [Verrucomicrobiota bacterium]